MKKAIITLILLACSCQFALAQQVTNAEKLTPAEIKTLADAKAKVDAAQAQLQSEQDKIAKAHGMVSASWMEYGQWYQISGDWILAYYQNYRRTSNAIAQ